MNRFLVLSSTWCTELFWPYIANRVNLTPGTPDTVNDPLNNYRTQNHRIDYRIETKALNSEGRKFGKCEFFVEMWVVAQISEEKMCIIGKKLLGPENAEEKTWLMEKIWWVGTE